MPDFGCMFDSGYTHLQGREVVINYFYPLQYGYDGLIKMCEDIAETAGRLTVMALSV